VIPHRYLEGEILPYHLETSAVCEYPACQFMNLCSPPALRIASIPGQAEGERHCLSAFSSISYNSSVVSVFTVAFVATGMNAGVSMNAHGLS